MNDEVYFNIANNDKQVIYLLSPNADSELAPSQPDRLIHIIQCASSNVDYIHHV